MKPTYLTPRMCIAVIEGIQDISKLQQLVETRHKQYHHYFCIGINKEIEQKCT